MKVRKFVGPNAREALRLARHALGRDAVVLSSRDVVDGVELLAIAERDMSVLIAGPQAAAPMCDARESVRVAQLPLRDSAPQARESAPARHVQAPAVREGTMLPSREAKLPEREARLPREAKLPGLREAKLQARAAPLPAGKTSLAAFLSRDTAAPDQDAPPQPRSEDAEARPASLARLDASATTVADAEMGLTGSPAAALPLTGTQLADEVKAIRDLLERELAALGETARSAPAEQAAQLSTELRAMKAAFERELAALAKAAAAQAALAARARDTERGALAEEVKAIRALIQREIAPLAWRESDRRHPRRAELMRRLLGAGLSPRFGRHLLDALPADLGADAAAAWLREKLIASIPCTPPEAIVDGGGIFALVGPTGVGKTTTLAKLASRCAMKSGASRLAIITTDGYRVGAYDQLRAYAKILGVPLQAVQDAQALTAIVDGLRDRHLVLVDTAGMGQRDARLSAELEALDAAGARRLVLLNASAQAEHLEDVVRAYASTGVAGCIITKVDEAMKLGAVIDCVARHRLPIAYVANGQRVPEDLHTPNLTYLAHRALRPATDDAFVLADEEFALLARAPMGEEHAA